MADRKELTVVIPTYNRTELTDRAVNSVFSQRADLLEVVVVDDCGFQVYDYGDCRNIHGIDVRVVRTPANVGPGMARKFGIERSLGSAIAFLDSDDVYEDGWLDDALDEFSRSRVEEGGLFIAGAVKHASPVTGALYSVLTRIPESFRTVASRLAIILFNPFYTPSLVLSRDLCRFSDSLRYCEDYYTNTMAIFMARKVVLSSRLSCSISARGEFAQGESARKWEMFRGELSTRLATLNSKDIPVVYKFFIPVGVLYQLARTSFQLFLSSLMNVGSRT